MVVMVCHVQKSEEQFSREGLGGVENQSSRAPNNVTHKATFQQKNTFEEHHQS